MQVSQCVGLVQAHDRVKGWTWAWCPSYRSGRRGCSRRGWQHRPFLRGWEGAVRGAGGGNSKWQILLLLGSRVTTPLRPVNFSCQHAGMAEEVSGQDGALFGNQLGLWPGVLKHLVLPTVPDGFIYDSFTQRVIFYSVVAC